LLWQVIPEIIYPKIIMPKGLAWREANLLVLAARTPDPAATIIAAHELLPD
jgi:hypothetical protein